MPNGRPGDNPFTDIVNHQINPGVPNEVYELVLEMSRSENFDHVKQDVHDLLWNEFENDRLYDMLIETRRRLH